MLTSSWLAGRWTTWTRTPGCCPRDRWTAAFWDRRSRVCWPISLCGSSWATGIGTRRTRNLKRSTRVRTDDKRTLTRRKGCVSRAPCRTSRSACSLTRRSPHPFRTPLLGYPAPKTILFRSVVQFLLVLLSPYTPIVR